MNHQRERTLGGTMCDSVLFGVNENKQLAVQLLQTDVASTVLAQPIPFAFIILPLEQAEQFHNDLGRMLAQIKGQLS